jgi:two-component system alkaline phosphatase synthesis response regulator PhoP
MKNVLVIEDEPGIARLIRDYLEQAGFAVQLASDGERALAMAGAIPPDLVVLDLGLPGIDGLDVTRQLRGRSAVPIIVVTARGDETDRIVGLELGADDYMVKPFSPKELVARVRAVLRRMEVRAVEQPQVRAGGLTIDVPRRKVTIGERDVDLTASEFELLLTLAREPGRVFTRAQLLDAVHGVAFESYERAIDAHIKNIRRKVDSVDGPSVIQTIYGVGYRFAESGRV